MSGLQSGGSQKSAAAPLSRDLGAPEVPTAASGAQSFYPNKARAEMKLNPAEGEGGAASYSKDPSFYPNVVLAPSARPPAALKTADGPADATPGEGRRSSGAFSAIPTSRSRGDLRERYVLSLDQGTTSTRAILFTHEGRVHASAQLKHKQITPRPGWVEHDPKEIWKNTLTVIEGALLNGGITDPAQSIVCVSITNQRETTVVWDRHTGEPVYNAIVWQDTRTDELCSQLAQGQNEGADRWKDRVGLPLSTYFSGPKARWVLDNVPGARDRAATGDLLFGTIDSWLVYHLTGGPQNGGRHVTDVTNASRTMLMELETLAWAPDIAAALQVPLSMLPEIIPSSAIVGAVKAPAALKGVPLCGILGDQQASLLGHAALRRGQSKCTYGTGCFLLLNTGKQIVRKKSGLLTTVAFQFPGQAPAYAVEGSVAYAGSLMEWLQHNMKLIDRVEDADKLAAPDSGGVYFVPAFTGLLTPRWRPDARGVLVGLTSYATKGHIIRAALEAVAYQVREVIDELNRVSGIPHVDGGLKVDGGLTNNEAVMQFQADILGTSVLRAEIRETSALGAAYAGGLGVRFWRCAEEFESRWGADALWEPQIDATQRDQKMLMWNKAVQRSLCWVEIGQGADELEKTAAQTSGSKQAADTGKDSDENTVSTNSAGSDQSNAY